MHKTLPSRSAKQHGNRWGSRGCADEDALTDLERVFETGLAMVVKGTCRVRLQRSSVLRGRELPRVPTPLRLVYPGLIDRRPGPVVHSVVQ